MLAEWTGLEPATPGVTGRYSNQLNYRTKGCSFQKRLRSDFSRHQGAFDSKAGAKVLLFFQIRKYLRIFLSLYLHFIESGTEHTAYIGN